MSIVDLLGAESILDALHGTSLDAIFVELCAPIAQRESIPRDELVLALAEREALASTAIGHGLAIPHGVHPQLTRVVGALGRARAGLALATPDGQPVRLFFALIRPPDAASAHLKALARVSRLLATPGVCEALLAAEDAAAMRAIVVANADGPSA
jgi:mannitol/fructose-specific phosphotransferase system IIA component (Ntr-type)